MAAASEKLEYCEVCGTGKAIYTCPKCEVRTCCLMCVNIHKKELECDGIRNKTKFIPLKQFTDLDLLSDYRLLEEIGRTVETVKKNMEQKKMTSQNSLPVHLYKLRSAAYQKKIRLLFMPHMFSRHKENTTFLNWKTNELFWRVQWIFPHAQNAVCVMEKALDSIRLSKLVEQTLEPMTSCKGEVDIETLNAKLILSDKLQFYRAAGISNISVLLKAERVKRAKSKFYELDVTLSLGENLENRTVVEYPTFYIIMKEHTDMFEIIDSDEEIEDVEYHRKVGQKRAKFDERASKSLKNKEGPVNYFFDDFSESDDEKVNKKSEQSEPSFVLEIPRYEDLIDDA